MEKIKIELSADEEFYLALGIILNNWYALQVGVNESFRPASVRQKQLEDIFWTAYNGIIGFKRNECSWNEVVEYLESSMSMDLDVVLEDGSSAIILHDILDTYNEILKNNREQIIQKLKNYKNKWHLLNGEEIDFLKLDVIRKSQDSSSGLPSISSCQNITSDQTGEPSSDMKEDDEVIYLSDGTILTDNNMETDAEVATLRSSNSDQRSKNSVEVLSSKNSSIDDDWTTVSRRKSKR